MEKQVRKIEKTASAYSYPLLIKQLLHTPILYAPDQEIVYRDQLRFSYRDLYGRINRLASALDSLGVGPGTTVAVLDWDSHRYLESFFAVPMMGAILHTVNIRLSPDQILYTMNHAEDDVVLVHEDFLPILEGISGQLTTVKKYILLKEGAEKPATSLPIAAEYEEMLAQGSDSFNFPEFDEDTQASTFYTTGTTGDPKGVYYSHRQLVLHTLGTAVAVAGYTAPGRFQSADVYMPITPMFHVHAWGFPFVATMLGRETRLSGQVRARDAPQTPHVGEGYLFALCTHDSSHDSEQPGCKGCRPPGLEGSHRRIRASERVGKDRYGARNRHLCGLRHVRDLSCSDPGQSQAGDDGLGGWAST